MRKHFNKTYFPAMLGASMEYYDISLYGFMAPILVQVFLPHLAKIDAYFFYFLFEFFAALCQIAGARFYGKMGNMHGRKVTMYWAMVGTSCVTGLTAVIPTYEMIGIAATILFAVCRLAQNFFLGGEYNGGAIYCLEHGKTHNNEGFISGLYCAMTVTGIITASAVATIVNTVGTEYFRLAYGVSFLLAFYTYKIRSNLKETPEYIHSIASIDEKMSSTTLHRKFLAIVVTSLFFGVLYGLPTKIFNAIMPMAVGIGSGQIMLLNTIFLLLYMVALISFGVLADHYGCKRIMVAAASVVSFVSFPLMLLIETKLLWAIIVAKAVFTMLSAAFIGPFHAWAQSLFNAKTRYLNISTFYAIGKCGSTIILASSILIFDHYQNLISIGFIFILTAIITARILYETPTT